MDIDRILNHYRQRYEDPAFEIDQVRPELERAKLDDEKIRFIVQMIDKELQAKALERMSAQRATNVFWVGVVITGVGVAITLGTFTGIIDMGDHYLLTYGPVLGGLSILFAGLSKRKRGPRTFLGRSKD